MTDPQAATIAALQSEIARLDDKASDYEEALHRIVQWADAYPLDIFPEPDFKKVRELLSAGGITIDTVSASNMRHVVDGVGKIARAALSAPDVTR